MGITKVLYKNVKQ